MVSIELDGLVRARDTTGNNGRECCNGGRVHESGPFALRANNNPASSSGLVSQPTFTAAASPHSDAKRFEVHVNGSCERWETTQLSRGWNFGFTAAF